MTNDYGYDKSKLTPATPTDCETSDVGALADAIAAALGPWLTMLAGDRSVVDAVLASDWLAARDARVAEQARAEAWAEGYAARRSEDTHGPGDSNPYRRPVVSENPGEDEEDV